MSEEVTPVLDRTIRRVVTVIGAVIGVGLVLGNREAWSAWPYFAPLGASAPVVYAASGLVLGALVGYLASPWVAREAARVMNWAEHRLQRTPAADLMAGSIGLIVGLLVAFLVGQPFSALGWIGDLLRIAISVAMGYVGVRVAARKKEELLRPSAWLPKLAAKPARGEGPRPKILDTSVIIDGRIADICASGFLEGPLVIPGFVLEELRHIADSADMLKRNRGRRGLDILNRIQKELNVPVQVYEKDVDPALEVDSKLLKLAKQIDGKVVTNDYNLNKVAELQGVPVLNINELANAVKPVVLPGEEMLVHVIKDGKEAGQGVGYLDDGTMIVVDGGKKHIGQTVGVMVTSVLQTAAGRMIFAKLKPTLSAAVNDNH
jgi:uncharacterized protein YacL